MSTTLPRGNIGRIFAVSVTFDPAAVATITTAEQNATVAGVQVGDIVYPVKPSLTTGVGIVNARVSAANTVAITFVNPTAGSVNPASETWIFLVFRPTDTLPAAVAP